MASAAISVQGVSFHYGDRRAVDDVSIEVAPGEIFGLLGPNGGGKTTLFRLLATLLPLTQGSASIDGVSVAADPSAVRRRIGVTFQSPSLDPKLTVRENLLCQGRLYGLSGGHLADRAAALAGELGVADRMRDRAETLSGGLKRRVEIAKCLLHEPRVLLLDEPSTGLDPGIRHALWQSLRNLVADRGLTILATTHLLDEAEHCGRLAILDRGRIVAIGAPHELRGAVGGECLTIHADDVASLADDISAAFQLPVQRLDDALRIEHPRGAELLRDLMLRFGDRVRSVTLGRPTLEDVFIHHTGRRLSE
jgi:ABC-2 type transport system ATP-binding protein